MILSSNQPLAGKRILVTRASRQAGRLSNALRRLGAEVTELPVIEIVPPLSYGALDEALQNINLYQWLIFTSANAVRVMVERLDVLRLEATSITDCKIVAVGPATVDALRSAGFRVALVPESHVAEGVIEVMNENVADSRVLLVRAKEARDVIPAALQRRGALVDIVEAYETVMPADSVARLPAALASLPDAITFTSSSTVRNFVDLLRKCAIETPLGLRAISIGPVTSQTLREAGWEPFAEAASFDIDGLVEATVRALKNR